MKVNFILPGLGDSGGIRVVKTYARLMNDRGIDTVIYCPLVADNLHRYRNEFKNRLHQFYCTIKTIKEIKEKTDITWIPFVSDRYVRAADHTIATMWATAYKVNKLSSCVGKKWYFIQDFEIWDNYDYGINSYRLPLNKIVISSWINNNLKEKLGIGPFPVVMNGIDTSIYHNDGVSKKDNVIVFLMLNHTLEKKGVKQGLEVFERINRKYKNTKLMMFGMYGRNNLPDYVEYVQNPSMQELVHLYSSADIFIFPSLEEGWGLTPIEAMACGCAVVGTNTGFVLDLGKHRENMMISEPGNVDQMVKNAEELITTHNLYEYIRNKGKETVNILSFEKSCNQLVDLLEDYI